MVANRPKLVEEATWVEDEQELLGDELEGGVDIPREMWECPSVPQLVQHLVGILLGKIEGWDRGNAL